FEGTFCEALRRRPRMYAGLAATWLLLAALMLGSSPGARGIGYGGDIGAWQYALTESRAIVTYLRLAVWPSPLIFDYGPGGGTVHLGDVWLPVAAIGLLLAATVLGLRRRWAGAFLAAAFFLILAPTSSFVPIVHQPVAESRMYLPLAAVSAALVLGVRAAARRGTAPILIAAGLALAGLTVRRNGDFRDGLTLWGDTVAKRPGNVRARCQLGEALRVAGDLRGAQAQFEAALRIQPDYAAAHNDLGIVLSVDPAQLPAALAHFEAALRVAPGAAPIHNNHGVALSQVHGREANAQEEFRTAIRLEPGFADAHKNLANLLIRLPGGGEEAVREYGEALRFSPGDADAHANLAFGLALTRSYGEAMRQCEAALRLNPDHVRAHQIFGNILMQLAGRTPEAIGHYRRAVALEPASAHLWASLGLALVSTPAQREEGIAALREALKRDPNMKAARDALDRIGK
ncbi:MAG TPA: tetratricopeptide repeat protein, partial [Opitutaceae bacterium]|nr:tetratricopeptide repeat protein [Opitutaceae bacterium]